MEADKEFLKLHPTVKICIIAMLANMPFWVLTIAFLKQDVYSDFIYTIFVSFCLSSIMLMTYYISIDTMYRHKIDVAGIATLTTITTTFIHSMVILIAWKFNLGFSTIINMHIGIMLIPFTLAFYKRIKQLIKAAQEQAKRN